jgi:hypothetical protein
MSYMSYSVPLTHTEDGHADRCTGCMSDISYMSYIVPLTPALSPSDGARENNYGAQLPRVGPPPHCPWRSNPGLVSGTLSGFSVRAALCRLPG